MTGLAELPEDGQNMYYVLIMKVSVTKVALEMVKGVKVTMYSLRLVETKLNSVVRYDCVNKNFAY